MKTDFIYGLHAVETLLKKNPDAIQQLWVQKNRQDQRIKKIITLAKSAHRDCQTIDTDKIKKMLGDVRHQGVVAEVKGAPAKGENELLDFVAALEEPAFLLILDGVQDPHNLGACLRSADAAGVHAVIVPKDRAVGLTPAVRKVASGAAETVPFFQVINLARVMRQLQDAGIWLIGAAGEAGDELYDIDMKGSIAIVAGSEGEGMRQLTKKHCDYLVKIPMQGTVESLNVSVATGVLLFEVVRQRGDEKI